MKPPIFTIDSFGARVYGNRRRLVLQTDSFDEFLLAHPRYAKAVEDLSRIHLRLALASTVVYHVHGEALGAVADTIVGYVAERYGPGALTAYAARAEWLAGLQEKFESDPTPRTLGDPSATVDRDDYNIALLLSIVFTNHRFEVMAQLVRFLEALAANKSGRFASIGTGTGYELYLTGKILPHWAVESYDIDPTVQTEAQRFLQYTGSDLNPRFEGYFPLDEVDPARLGRYEALAFCEVLEHLPDPAQALRVSREYLSPGGRIFLTMAVNIAQEDHIFLYRSITECREQIKDSDLRIEWEWISPQTSLPPPENREHGFHKGNYIAVVTAAA
jgi:SAM-dependent methyltransferase